MKTFSTSLCERINLYGSSDTYPGSAYLDIHVYLFDRRIVITGVIMNEDGSLLFEYDDGTRTWLAPAESEPLWVMRTAADYIESHYGQH